MTYQPDSMTHLAGQYAGLFCTRCAVKCSEVAPCSCCPANQPEVEASAEPQADVQLITDGDVGLAGESS